MPEKEMTDKEYLDRLKKRAYSDNKLSSRRARLKVVLRNVLIEHEDGPEAFAFLLSELKYNQDLSLPVEMALHNVAVKLLEIMDLNEETTIIGQIKTWKNN